MLCGLGSGGGWECIMGRVVGQDHQLLLRNAKSLNITLYTHTFHPIVVF